MNVFKTFVCLSALILLITGCREEWDQYYHKNDEPTVERNVWDVIREDSRFSEFVQFIEAAGIDSVFQGNISLTVFVPTNEAFSELVEDSAEINSLLQYHLLETVINLRNIIETKKLETLSGKYLLIEQNQGIHYIDGIKVEEESPLCLNGRYYVLDKLLYPKPTIYEYISVNSPIVKDFIDSYDSVFLDINESTPIGYDEFGNTIYDSVFSQINLFDTLYFPVDQEYRSKAATIILFDEDQYVEALDVMASDLGGNFNTHIDIPTRWQLNVLIPLLIENGIFENALQYDAFKVGDMKNIQGDSIFVDYTNVDPDSRVICSNGILYKYLNFVVPDSLYQGRIKVEGESFVELIGAGVYGWNEEVSVSGSGAKPVKVFADAALNDTIINVELGIRYTGDYLLEVIIPDILPQKYIFEWGANFRPSGKYEVYINDVLVGEHDLYYMRSTIVSVTGEIYIPESGINVKDFWVDHIEDYGDVKVGFKYIGGGVGTFNGLSIDYVGLVPVPE